MVCFVSESLTMEDRASEVLPREFLCCPLCREEFQDPRYLICMHSFCKSCIEGHIDATSDDNGCFVCPVCATESVVSDTETMELPANSFARRLICPTAVPGKRDKTCGQCKTSGRSVTAKVHCINCDDFLCDKCALSHVDQEETISHKTQKIENYKEADMTVYSSVQIPALARCCAFYDALDIGSIYCVDCEVSLCADCHTKLHADHRCAELSAISQNFENKIKDPLKDLMKDQHSLQTDLVYLENARKYAVKKCQEVKNAVKQRTQVLCGLVQEYGDMLVMETEKRHAQNLAIISEREDAIHRHTESIRAVTQLTEQLFIFGLEEEKVAMRRQIGRRVRELCETDLPVKDVCLASSVFSEPPVSVETICEMFGMLKNTTKKINNKKKETASNGSESTDTGSRAISQSASSADELQDMEDEGGDTDMLSASNTSDVLRTSSTMLSESDVYDDRNKITDVGDIEPRNLQAYEASQADDVYKHSAGEEDVPCLNLEVVKREMHFPDIVTHDCMKGVGINSKGDIIVATVSPHEGSKVFLLEKHGIVRGQIPVDKNWLVHSITADGKVNLVMPRGENRYRVRVMSGENNVDTLADAHIESFGLNSVTATKSGTLLVAASRYAMSNPVYGRSAKYGGNITMHDRDGTTIRIITNETFESLHPYLFDRPHTIATDHHGNFFVADPGRHSVVGFQANGDFLFEYGNTDAEEELYQGPDAVCTDRLGNVIVFDKKDGRIDILNYHGDLQRCYFPCEHIRFVCVTPDRALMLVNSVGDMKFFDYL